MRPGRPDDKDALLRLLQKEAREGRRETVPRRWMDRAFAAFDWETSSRIVANATGALEGAVLVTHREYSIGTITRVEVGVTSAADRALRGQLVKWGLEFSRAAGAAAAQVWLPRGQGGDLTALGLVSARPWWRMDRGLSGELPPIEPVAGYRLLVGGEVATGVWSDVHNLSFADHWRYSIRGEDELMQGRSPDLCLLLVDPTGHPAAITLGQVQTNEDDSRQQPVGLVNSVATLPEHRRRGLARWLVTEMLPRLRNAGARSASLYVDGMNPTGAPRLYRDLGFEVAFETEVWEARFP